jgi:hypothetical protein
MDVNVDEHFVLFLQTAFAIRWDFEVLAQSGRLY